MPLPRFGRNPEEAVVAGVCAGIARTLGVDPTLVRLVFTLLALAGGAGVLLYLALWFITSQRSIAGYMKGLIVILVIRPQGILGRREVLLRPRRPGIKPDPTPAS